MGRFKNKKPRTGFSRPQATVGIEIDRSWSTIAIKNLAIGDIIAGMGIVKNIYPTCKSDEYYLEAGESTEDFFPADQEVLAFVKKVK